MLNIFKNPKRKTLTVISPQTGKSIPINQIPDEVFSEKILGDGVAIIPKENKIVSPIDGEIVQVAETGHAFCIHSEEGLELIIHIGVNTVSLKGKGFECFVKNGDAIKKGDIIGTADIKFIEESGYPLHTAVLITNLEKFQNFKPIYDTVKAGKTPIITYEIK